MGKIYLEQVLEQLVDKANVIVQTRDSDYAPTYRLGNHYAARWRLVLEQKFPAEQFGVVDITSEIKGGTLMWVITIDLAHGRITDRLSTEANCRISGLDF